MRFLSIGEAMGDLSRTSVGDDLWRLGFAGDALNTAWYLRACLPDQWQVDYLTRLGQDPFSPRLLAFMRESRIGTEYVSIDPTRSVGLYSIELQDGERSFSYWRGQSAARLLAEDPALLDRAFAQADAIYFSGITLAILPEAGRKALVSRMIAARAKGKLTAFDPNMRPKLWEKVDEMRDWQSRAAEGAQIVLPSFDDEARWFGDASLAACAARWSDAGAQEVVVKNGGGSIGLLDPSGYQEIPVESARPVDSAGAGDSFNGGYLAARLAGADCVSAVHCGHAIAGKVIALPGALVRIASAGKDGLRSR